MKKLILLNIFAFIICGSLFADEQVFNISGKIYFSNKKPIYVYLVDEETSKKPFTGNQTLIITPSNNDISNGYISFQFNNIKPDIYGIRCFQDLNDNKKLDKGLIGPSEPWGLSWNNDRITQWPSFENFNFNVTTDVDNINIKLKD